MIASPQLPGATERFLNDMAPRVCRFTGTSSPRREFGRRRVRQVLA